MRRRARARTPGRGAGRAAGRPPAGCAAPCRSPRSCSSSACCSPLCSAAKRRRGSTSSSASTRSPPSARCSRRASGCRVSRRPSSPSWPPRPRPRLVRLDLPARHGPRVVALQDGAAAGLADAAAPQERQVRAPRRHRRHGRLRQPDAHGARPDLPAHADGHHVAAAGLRVRGRLRRADPRRVGRRRRPGRLGGVDAARHGAARSTSRASRRRVALFLLFLAVVLLNVLADRFWCRYLCPLGALLGLLAKVQVLRPLVGDGCTDCGALRALVPARRDRAGGRPWRPGRPRTRGGGRDRRRARRRLRARPSRGRHLRVHHVPRLLRRLSGEGGDDPGRRPSGPPRGRSTTPAAVSS